MKNLDKLIFFLLAAFIYSCASSAKIEIPEILTAQYEIKTYSEFEKGYEVFMVIDEFSNDYQIKAIILKNKVFEDIRFTRMRENEIFVEQFLPLHSQLIQKFQPPATDNRPDGILFEINGQEFYKEINFKLK